VQLGGYLTKVGDFPDAQSEIGSAGKREEPSNSLI
jgi:hypothetical protein